MFIRLISIGLVVTLVTSLPAYLLFTDPTATSSSALPGLIAAYTFIIALVSAWLGRRFLRPTTSASVTATEESRELGTVKWFNANKGFGFITRDSGEDVFVHFRSIRGKGHRVLRDGQRVDFLVSEGDKGLQAEDVAVAS
ncbi:MAG: cold-shock protein [Gammaproteobacteria bacterium]|nr:cold-shock protein [Gammaproteobacteria bacterium]